MLATNTQGMASPDLYDTNWWKYENPRHANALNIVQKALNEKFSDDFRPILPLYLVNAIIANVHNPNMVLSLWDVFLESHIGHIPDIKKAVRDVLSGMAKNPFGSDKIY